MFEHLAVLFHLKGSRCKEQGDTTNYAPATRAYYFRYGA
ncbi:hypothetical protein SAMN05880558_104135 [Aeromonas sp. RU39B]|mgnify:CR=1 FL=1|jgi:hypothetical protein|nr:hypothetical protein SAMN05880558_104135 [Aeromonas sp. RU39B]